MRTGHPKVGERAPDGVVFGLDGRSVALASLWERGPLALVFLRHYG